MVTEVGRQPWIVYGLMRTSDAVSPIAALAGGDYPDGLHPGVLAVGRGGVLPHSQICPARAGPAPAVANSGRSHDVADYLVYSLGVCGPFTSCWTALTWAWGTLMPFLAKDDTDRRVIYRAMGPFWDGQRSLAHHRGRGDLCGLPDHLRRDVQWPYSALMLILFALILRGVSMVFRGEVDDPRWRRLWDTGLFLGSFLPALLFGVAFANCLRASPSTPRASFRGTSLPCSTPTAWPGASCLSCLFLVHGSLWLAVKTHGELHRRAAHLAVTTWPVLLGMAVIFLAATRGGPRSLTTTPPNRCCSSSGGGGGGPHRHAKLSSNGDSGGKPGSLPA